MEPFENLHPDFIHEKIITLRSQSYTWTSIARFFSVSRRKIRSYALRHGIGESFTMLEDNDQTRHLIWTYINDHNNCGEVSLMGVLRGFGLTIRRADLRAIIRDIDPNGRASRVPRGKTARVQYEAYGPGYIWHVDTWHKLGMTAGIVVVRRILQCIIHFYFLRQFDTFFRCVLSTGTAVNASH